MNRQDIDNIINLNIPDNAQRKITPKSVRDTLGSILDYLEAFGSSEVVKSVQWVIGTDKPVNAKVQDDDLIDAEILGAIIMDNYPIQVGSTGVTFDSSTGIIDFTVMGELYDGNVITLVYKKTNP